jgi:hypothetical protein
MRMAPSAIEPHRCARRGRRADRSADATYLSADEVYALTAYLLFLNQVIREDEVLDKQSLPKVKMPHGDDYTRLPDWKPSTPRLQGYPY